MIPHDYVPEYRRRLIRRLRRREALEAVIGALTLSAVIFVTWFLICLIFC